MSTTTTYSAAQIGKALGVSRQAVHKLLADVVASETRVVGGNVTKSWAVGVLPEGIRMKLGTRAEAGGFSSLEHLLVQSDAPWTPSVPLAECAQQEVDKAVKLRAALAGTIARKDDVSLSRTEFEAFGLEDYRKQFGHVITSRHWWDLFSRTLDRAGARQDFARLELYLDERPARKAEPKPVENAGAGRFPKLEQAVALVQNPAALADGEDRAVWLAALESFEADVEAGLSGRLAKETLFTFLMAHVPGLAKSRNALRMAFERRYIRWKSSGEKVTALVDARGEANRLRAKPVSQDDKKLLTYYAATFCDGRISQALRECLDKGLLSQELSGRILSNPASKSYVPNSLRDLIKHDVRMVNELHHGERHTRDNGAYIDRCWEGMYANEWWSADDCTLPVYFYVPDGKGWFTLMRGQFLLMIDARSTCILQYALMPERNYNARVIRSLITRTADEYGLPRKGFYFERGIWKDSKILKGNQGDVPTEWGQAELGLKEFGLKFTHAIRARSKPVERVFGALQSLMEGEPGYCGRDERSAGFESFKKLKLSIESSAQKVDPRRVLYSLDQWDERLGEICAQYNATQQGGKMTRGLSPEDAMEKFKSPEPAMHFGANMRHLLATHKRPVMVTANGITLRYGKQVYNFRNEQTGQLRGQRVLAWFDPDSPEILTVTDLDRKKPFLVERSQSVPALDAPEDILAQELGRVEDHNKYPKTLYRTLKAKFAQQFRKNLVSPEVIGTGREIERQKAEIGERESLKKVAARLAVKIGAPLPTSRNTATSLDYLREEQELRARLGKIEEITQEPS